MAEDHQTKNAMALVEKNAALMVHDSEAKGKMISSAIDLLNDEIKKTELADNLKKLAKPNAAAEIANVVINLIGK